MDVEFHRLLPIIALGLIFISAMRSDLKERRIPNALVLGGLITGLVMQSILKPGMGLFNSAYGALGFVEAGEGALLGLALLLPMYAVGALGAGDVKFMAVIGSFLGPTDIVGATVFTLLAGGVLAISVAAVQGQLRQVMHNIKLIIFGFLLRAFAGQGLTVDAPAKQTGKLPYAIAICTGTAAYLLFAKAAGYRIW
ncbi:A24 family peptidase [Pseudoduganella sp. RAF53_2]|uniref:A24 family peptidase n=1 Tax=unclassified Pseudoduganella TaxID=2637179 RepID=UPI003F97FC32